MPIYVYECGDGHRTEDIARIEDRKNAVECGDCGAKASRVIVAASVQPDIEEYFDENIVPSGSSSPGVVVKSRRHRERLMRENHLVELPPTRNPRVTGRVYFT